jgi:SAM-dependent methyltransferase
LLLREAGLEPIGVDISGAMLSYARCRNPDTVFHRLDVLDQHTELPSVDGIFAQALIHLFPGAIVTHLVSKLARLLPAGGVLSVSTTDSSTSREGWRSKSDYSGGHLRFRKDWTRDELVAMLNCCAFELLADFSVGDAFDKKWIVAIGVKADALGGG